MLSLFLPLLLPLPVLRLPHDLPDNVDIAPCLRPLPDDFLRFDFARTFPRSRRTRGRGHGSHAGGRRESTLPPRRHQDVLT